MESFKKMLNSYFLALFFDSFKWREKRNQWQD